MRFFLSLLCFCLSTTLCASQPFSRTLLALFNSDHDAEYREDFNPVTEAAEMPLNWLGMELHFHDIAQGLPSEEETKGTRAILSWFQDSKMRNPEAYLDWAKKQIEAGRRFIIMGEIGCETDLEENPVPLEKINSWLSLLGLEMGSEWTDNPFSTSILYKDPAMIDFERSLDVEDVQYCMQIYSISDRVRTYLALQCGSWGEKPIVAVCTSPTGGFVRSRCALYSESDGEQMRWLIDPFLFFQIALGLDKAPAYDATTLFGRRIAFSHIDGDGVRNATEMKETQDIESGQVILHEVLEKYWFPFTASFITCEINTRYLGFKRVISTAREIFALPHIECGSHTFSHPLQWNRQLTSFALPGYSKEIDPQDYPDVFDGTLYDEGALITVPEEEFLQTEIVESMRFLNHFICPPGKRVVMTQWSGNCEPQPRGIELAYKENTGNINRGDSRFDQAHPSYTRIAPLTRRVGGWVQVHAPNANDDIYTNSFTGPFYGFRQVIQTFQQSERPTLFKAPPRRVLPMNIYYHYYSGEKESSLKAVQEVIEYVLAQPKISLWASDYFRCVIGWVSGRIGTLPDDGWHFSNYGACRTIRFQDEARYPDLDRSQNIWGFTRWENFLYVTVGPEEAKLYWSETPPQQPYLVSSEALIEELQMGRDQIRLTTRPFGPTRFHFAGLPPNRTYVVEVSFDNEREGASLRDRFESDEGGALVIDLDIRRRCRIEITNLQ